ncbi:MAG TPA: hypothetical protein VNU96_04170 [Burkholderiales bacterium]|jgi:hypothetical protein|nr:hypothetical protein [Burkholderiales bacterium]
MKAPINLSFALVMLLFTAGVGAQTLDYAQFKSSVEPIFLKKRPGHTRCVVCHSDRSNNLLKLEKLAPGAKTWSEEQSRRNFETVSRLVVPGKPGSSLLLLHPLAPEAGGDAYHSGGRQFENRDDADWKTLARWVGGG